MAAIKPHKTPVTKTGTWDGSKALIEAKNDVSVLRYMHAWVNESGDPSKKSSYLFPHHESGIDTPAIIAGVNNALVRLMQSKLPVDERLQVEDHLRQHRVDAGLGEGMSGIEITDALKQVKKLDDLKTEEVKIFTDTMTLQEKSNLAEWLESRLHLSLTQMADDMFGSGTLTRDERKILSGAIGEALDSYHNFLKENAPQLFQRRPWEDAPGEGQPISEALKEIVLVESAIALEEKAVRGDGTEAVKIIQPGWGSSGFYSKEVLQRDGAKAFPKGTKMLWNHPTVTEEAERPEGDLKDLASELVSDARWMERGQKGPGLYADAKVFESFQGAVNDLAPHIGVSIHARGKGVYGEADGRQGVIVQEIMESPFNRVDYVTMPGAGGEIISLFEAARTPIPSPSPKVGEGDKTGEGKTADKTKAGTVPATEATHSVANHLSNLEEDMELKDLQERLATLENNNQTLVANNARLNEALILRDAKDVVKEALAAVTALPDITKARLAESLAKNPPVKDGALDKVAFTAAISEAVKNEVKYLESVLGTGQIRGLGESVNDGEEQTPETLQTSLEESFTAIGLSEAGSKIAARGRK